MLLTSLWDWLVSGRTDVLRREERWDVRVSFFSIAVKQTCEEESESLEAYYSLMFTIFFTRAGVKFVNEKA